MTRQEQRKFQSSSSSSCPPCDVMIIHHEDDHTTAQQLQEKVHSLAPCATCRLFAPQGNGNSAPLPTVPLRSFVYCVQVWVLLSEKALEDATLMFYKDELIMRSVTTGRNQFIPVFTRAKNLLRNLPFGLAAYSGLTLSDRNVDRSISRMLNGKCHSAQKDQLMEAYRCQNSVKHQDVDSNIPQKDAMETVKDQRESIEDMRELREDLIADNQQREPVFNITINGKPLVKSSPGEPRTEPVTSTNHRNVASLSQSVASASQRSRVSRSFSSSSSSSCSSSMRTQVYNITINQPEVVNIF